MNSINKIGQNGQLANVQQNQSFKLPQDPQKMYNLAKERQTEAEQKLYEAKLKASIFPNDENAQSKLQEAQKMYNLASSIMNIAQSRLGN